MKAIVSVVFAVVLLAAPGAGLAADPVRVTDKAVEQQFQQVEKGLNRFIDGMDPKIRTAILKGEQGEIDVKVVLNDLKDSLKQAKDRFSPGSANAVTEAVGFLKKAKSFDKGLALRPGLSGADMKWADLVPDLAKLASAYGIDWKAEPEGWVSSRTNDKELQAAVQAARKGADVLAKELDNLLKKDKANAAARASAATVTKDLAGAAKGLEDALKSKADSTAAVTRLLSARTGVSSFMDATAAAAAVKPSWVRTSGSIDAIAKAYGVR